MLQARFSQHDDRFYNPGRDVAHAIADMMREVAARLEDKRWPVLRKLLQDQGITDDDLGQACGAFCTFVASAVEQPKESMDACLRRCGWYDGKEAAQIGVMAMLGTVVAGYAFAGMRESTIQGVGPALHAQDLREAGRRCSEYIAMPRWWLRWYRLKDWLQRVWNAVRGRTAD